MGVTIKHTYTRVRTRGYQDYFPCIHFSLFIKHLIELTVFTLQFDTSTVVTSEIQLGWMFLCRWHSLINTLFCFSICAHSRWMTSAITWFYMTALPTSKYGPIRRNHHPKSSGGKKCVMIIRTHNHCLFITLEKPQRERGKEKSFHNGFQIFGNLHCHWCWHMYLYMCVFWHLFQTQCTICMRKERIDSRFKEFFSSFIVSVIHVNNEPRMNGPAIVWKSDSQIHLFIKILWFCEYVIKRENISYYAQCIQTTTYFRKIKAPLSLRFLSGILMHCVTIRWWYSPERIW